MGQTKNFENRKRGHLYGARKGAPQRIYRSMRKHGFENFVFEILEECVDDVVNEREQHWVAHFDSFNPEKGYNMTSGGLQNTHVSDETKKKLSEALKGNKHNLGRVPSYGTRQLLKKCGQITTERRFGLQQVVNETRRCHCGVDFNISYAVNRKRHVKTTCSSACAHKRSHNPETKSKIAKALSSPVRDTLKERIKQGEKLTVLQSTFNVSYSTLKKIKRNVLKEKETIK